MNSPRVNRPRIRIAVPPETPPKTLVPRRRRKRHDPKVAVALIRVSTNKQDLGPEVQRGAIAVWAKREGVRIAAWYEERVSGAADPSKREGLISAMEGLRTHRAGVLVVHERTRLARDVDLAGYFRTLVRLAGAEVVTTDATGSRLESRIKDVLGEAEREEIRKRTRRALAVLRESGKRISRHAPFGYRFERGLVVEDEREQRILRRMRGLREAGRSYPEIAKALEDVPTRRGTTRWYAATIRNVLRRTTLPTKPKPE